jgi:thioredoxin 1
MSGFEGVTEATFEASVLKSALPVVVEFGAPWCVPCKRLEPILIELGQLWGAKAKLVQLNVDECVDLTVQYGVMSVPTVILFVAGQPVEQLSGLQSRQRLLEKLGHYILND